MWDRHNCIITINFAKYIDFNWPTKAANWSKHKILNLTLLKCFGLQWALGGIEEAVKFCDTKCHENL